MEIRNRIAEVEVDGITESWDDTGLVDDVCEKMRMGGDNGDETLSDTSRALAALDGRDETNMQDLYKAVKLCLQHRRTEPPEHQPQEGEADMDPDSDADEIPNGQEDEEFGIGERFEVKAYTPEPAFKSDRRDRRNGSIPDDGTGHAIGYMIPHDCIRSLSLSATVPEATSEQPCREHEIFTLTIKADDLSENNRTRSMWTDIVFVADGSDSIAARQSMTAVKEAILSLLNDVYPRWDRVGMAVFSEGSAEERLPMTRSVLNAFRRLRDMPAGGKAPLFRGLMKGIEMLEQSHDPSTASMMVVLTDGRVGSKRDRIREIGEMLDSKNIRTIVIDTETDSLRFGKTIVLASMLGADYIKLEELSGRNIRSALDSIL